MLAVKKNLTGAPDRKVMYCYSCGGQYSADKGDYFNHPEDHIFMCCDEPMVLGKMVTRFEATLDVEPPPEYDDVITKDDPPYDDRSLEAWSELILGSRTQK